eukprot:211425-Amphidinium_carterae.1
MTLTIEANGVGLMFYDTYMRPTNERLSRKHSGPSDTTISGIGSGAGSLTLGPGPLFRTNTQLWAH